MKTFYGMVAVAGIVFGLAAPATAATSDPEVIIYRFPGVRDNGGAPNTGVATVFHCTNFSGVLEGLRLVTRSSGGDLGVNFFSTIGHLVTLTISTHATTAYGSVFSIGTGQIAQGTAAIAATSTNIICTAMTIDASTAVPVGVALRGIRFSPVSGSQE
jgi:hypothetical protein